VETLIRAARAEEELLLRHPEVGMIKDGAIHQISQPVRVLVEESKVVVMTTQFHFDHSSSSH
jgi:hypothetical protein